MRTTLIPGLMEIASKNIHRRQLNLCLFEAVMYLFPKVQSFALEEPHIAALVTGGLVKLEYFFLKN